MKNVVPAALGFLLMAGGACVAQSDQPSLAELAKQNHTSKKATRVITNDDIAASPRYSNTDSVAPAASSAPAAGASASDAKSGDSKDAASNKAPAAKDPPAVAELKKKLDGYKAEQDGWKTSAKRYEDLLAHETDDFRRQMYQDALDGDKHNVSFFQGKIDQTQSDLAKAQKESQEHQ